MTLYQILYYFTIYAVLGWCLEVAAHVVTLGKFVNRGFLNGPVCPIYGFGATLVIWCLLPLRENLPVLFLASAVLTTALELVTGFLLERLFQTRWWDYSDRPFNFKGYICLLYSLAWGAACVVVVRVIHPAIATAVSWIPHTLGIILISMIMALFLCDLWVTVTSVRALNRHLAEMEQVAADLKELSDAMGGRIYQQMTKAIQLKDQAEEKAQQQKQELTEEWKQRQAEIQAKWDQLELGWRHKRLIKAFPHMKSFRYTKALERLRDRLIKK